MYIPYNTIRFSNCLGLTGIYDDERVSAINYDSSILSRAIIYVQDMFFFFFRNFILPTFSGKGHTVDTVEISPRDSVDERSFRIFYYSAHSITLHDRDMYGLDEFTLPNIFVVVFSRILLISSLYGYEHCLNWEKIRRKSQKCKKK